MLPSNLASLPATRLSSREINAGISKGILIALLIIGLWVNSLIWLFNLELSQISYLWIALAIFWQTFLFTGLFITAHDAMHGVVFPQNPKINNFIGTVTVSCYALFSYKKLLKKHWQHHRHPATELDPDFHDSKHKNFLAWYLHFMVGYSSWQQMLGLSVIYNSIHLLLHIPTINLNLFWVIPALLSSVQLFYFGTFLTHREPEGGYTNPHRAETNRLPVFWSFITCYHFGYHQEHHQYPDVPWWKLPEVYQKQEVS